MNHYCFFTYAYLVRLTKLNGFFTSIALKSNIMMAKFNEADVLKLGLNTCSYPSFANSLSNFDLSRQDTANPFS